jgi:hypothetical protein
MNTGMRLRTSFIHASTQIYTSQFLAAFRKSLNNLVMQLAKKRAMGLSTTVGVEENSHLLRLRCQAREIENGQAE